MNMDSYEMHIKDVHILTVTDIALNRHQIKIIGESIFTPPTPTPSTPSSDESSISISTISKRLQTYISNFTNVKTKIMETLSQKKISKDDKNTQTTLFKHVFTNILHWTDIPEIETETIHNNKQIYYKNVYTKHIQQFSSVNVNKLLCVFGVFLVFFL